MKAKRVVYFEDPYFKSIHAAQEGDLPFPEGPVPPMGELPLSVRATPTAPRGSGLTEKDLEARMGIGERGADAPAYPEPASDGRRVRAAVIADDQRQFEMDFGGPAEVDVGAASENDAAIVREALTELERLEGEIAGVPERADKAEAC
ncbi:MAG: hypothetical protein HC869_04900 [Rhodospirillales bacterium]|nr:hypothetical protein [Rhodospirillales bacterium]